MAVRLVNAILLGSVCDFGVVANGSSASESIGAIRPLRPSPALLAMAMSDLDALGAAKREMP
jgi:hypothetical protein